MTNEYHIPVLLEEVIRLLNIEKGAWYIDATAGGGGHTQEILSRGGNVLAIDRDQDAIEFLNTRFETEIKDGRLVVVQGRFRELGEITKKVKRKEVSGVLFDLGMSTHQIKESGRGFSFLRDEELDMRMDATQTLTARDIVNHFSEVDLYEIFRKFGEEHLARDIARAIVRTRAVNPIITTGALSSLIKEVYVQERLREKIHPATRVFQALRIAVNDELNELRSGLVKAWEVIKPGGRVVVISFHSLEDRVVKQYFLELKTQNQALVLTDKPVRVQAGEVRQNPAARSSKLRVIEKLN